MKTDTVEHKSNLGNTETKLRSRGWCFTYNNYDEREYEDIKEILHNRTLKFVIGKEEAPSTGTRHLQGYAYFKNPQTLKHLIKKVLPGAHWEIAKGSPDANLAYCTKTDEEAVQHGFKKEETFKEKIRKKLLDKYADVVWKPWQQKVLDIVEQEPDTRTINWIYDSIGNSGKSFLTKYLALTHELIIADGKKDNIFNQVNKQLNEEEKEFKLVILDIPRSSENYINYGVLEQLKNGCIYSGKYEGGLCLFDNVHVLIFANFMPDTSQFSEDRWNIIDISDE